MEHITLQGERLHVTIDAATGAFRKIINRRAGLSLITQPDVASQHPFMIVFIDGMTLQAWQDCDVQYNEAVPASDGQPSQAIVMHWHLERGLSLSAWLWLDAVGDLRCKLALENAEHLPVAAIAYPYVAGIGQLGTIPAEDELVHPYATGFLVRDPLDSLPSVVSETEGQQPVVLGLYPEGFSGSTMQFMAYSAAGRGGFYIAAEDSVGKEKWLNFYRHGDGDLRLSVWHGPDAYAGSRAVAPHYATVIAALHGGSWYDAADRYRAWALTQPWAARGPLWSRDDRCRWLLEDVGLCTFGIDPRHDRSPWLNEIDRIAGTPVMHILGANWPKTGCDYRNRLPAGLADWFPACFHPANLEVIRRHGDYLVPFEFDLLFGRGEGRADRDQGEAALQRIPQPTLSRDAYNFPFLCPATPFAQELHVARDRTLVTEYGVDGVYYDISVNNVRHICTSSEHGHRPGDTVALTDAYRGLLSDTAASMREAAGRPASGPTRSDAMSGASVSNRGVSIPQGTEMINEQMLPFLAFYQARAEASPVAPFEAGPFRELIKRGQAEKIPLFTYVYHEHGPVRLDGWAKLSREQGELAYFTLGRVFVQGGLIELNYEFSGLEDLEAHRDIASEHYYSFADRRYPIDPDVAAYVGQLSRMRVGPGNRYLAYGAMLRPAPLEVEESATLELEYFLYNCGQDHRDYEDRGTLSVPAVLQTAWRYRDEGIAWFLLNIAPDERVVHIEVAAPQPVPVPTSESTSTQPAMHRLLLHGEREPVEDLGTIDGKRWITLTLPPRRPVMLEALLTIGDGR